MKHIILDVISICQSVILSDVKAKNNTNLNSIYIMNKTKLIEQSRHYLFRLNGISPKIFIGTLAYLLISTLFSACNDTDNYYQILRNEPEIWMAKAKAYDKVYGIGDTMTIYGHFHSADLSIQIGDAQAKIISKEQVYNNGTPAGIQYKDSAQMVRLIITEAMGIGTDRPVIISSDGITREGTSIEIVKSTKEGILPNALTVQELADIPENTLFVYCRSDKGNTYMLDTLSYTLTRIKTDGTKETVFRNLEFKDNGGNTFKVDRLNGVGMDPREQYIYFSTFNTTTTGTTAEKRWTYYRLSRYNLQTNTLEVLNKTPYHIWRNYDTEAAAQPFEGRIDSVKMFAATGIFPDSAGNVLFDMGGRFITRLEKNGGTYQYHYLAKNSNADLSKQAGYDPAPQIYNEATDGYFPDSVAINYFPGKKIDFDNSGIIGWDPEEMLFYSRVVTTATYNNRDLECYDLNAMDMLSRHTLSTMEDSYDTPYAVGSFSILNYYARNGVGDDIFGLLPISSGRLILLKNQNLGIHPPLWAVLNFKTQSGMLYAPGAFNPKGFVMDTRNDILLNCDADGMLYMTANNRKKLIKTMYYK